MKSSRVLSSLFLCLATAAAAHAQELIIEARVALANGDAQYSEAAGNWANSSVHTTAPGTTAGVGSRFNTTAGSMVTLAPNVQPGGSYLLDAAFFAPSSQSADIVCRIDLVGCTLTDLDPSTFMQGDILVTHVFRRAGGSTSWRRIGKLVVDAGVTTPEVTFTHISGTLTATAGRFYSDAYRLVNASDPCLNGLPVLSTVNGPLAAGQTVVNVPAVDATATKVTVYANDVQIGQKTSGIVGGTTVEAVTTSPLVAGQVITITQHNASGVESCRPTTGPIVGSGANPPVRIAFSLRMDEALTGPIGTQGTSASGWLQMLGATGPASGFGTAPLNGTVLQPGTCWQTVVYDFNVDSKYTWAGAGTEPGTFAMLDSIAFSMEEPFDSGPYAIYIDNIVNGSTLIEDFEAATNGTPAYVFTAPSYSGSTSGNLLSQPPGSITPDITVVTNLNADTGVNSAFVNWQFKDTAVGSWLRLPLAGSGLRNPQVDLSQTISVRFLVLPLGQTEAALQVSAIGKQTGFIGDNVTLSVSAIKGTGPFTYQWKTNGVDIPGATASTLVFNNAQTSAAGSYSVTVANASCSTESFGTLTITEKPTVPVLTFNRENGLTLVWTDNQAVLQRATSLTGSPSDWSDLSTATSPYPVDSSLPVQFFRLKR